jgi:hypothetical protein
MVSGQNELMHPAFIHKIGDTARATSTYAQNHLFLGSDPANPPFRFMRVFPLARVKKEESFDRFVRKGLSYLSTMNAILTTARYSTTLLSLTFAVQRFT